MPCGRWRNEVVADVDAKGRVGKLDIHEHARRRVAECAIVDGEGAVVGCDLICNETGGEWADVGEVRVVGWWNEANVAEANAPLWVDNEEGAVVEGLEVVEHPKDGAKPYVYGVV